MVSVRRGSSTGTRSSSVSSSVSSTVTSPQSPTTSLPSHTLQTNLRSDRKMSAEDYYSQYDPMTGVNIALMLGSFILFMTFYLAIKEIQHRRFAKEIAEMTRQCPVVSSGVVGASRVATLRAVEQRQVEEVAALATAARVRSHSVMVHGGLGQAAARTMSLPAGGFRPSDRTPGRSSRSHRRYTTSHVSERPPHNLHQITDSPPHTALTLTDRPCGAGTGHHSALHTDHHHHDPTDSTTESTTSSPRAKRPTCLGHRLPRLFSPASDSTKKDVLCECEDCEGGETRHSTARVVGKNDRDNSVSVVIHVDVNSLGLSETTL